MGRSFWDVGGAQAWPIPGPLPIPTCAGSPKGPWGLGIVWGRGTGHIRVPSSLIRPMGTLSLFCSKGLWNRSNNMVDDQLLSRWHLGWRGWCGSPLPHLKPSQPRSGLPPWRHRTLLTGKGGGKPGAGTRWVWGPRRVKVSLLAWDKDKGQVGGSRLAEVEMGTGAP